METELLSRPAPRHVPDLGPADPETLIHQYQGMVWRYLRLLGADTSEADDLLQETFLKVISHPFVEHNNGATAALLRKVAHHAFVDARRRAGRQASVLIWTDAVEHWVAREPEVLDDDRIEALRQCLSRVRGRGQRALELRHSQGLSTRAIATQLGLSLNGLKSLLRRVRASLRDCVLRRLADRQEDQR